MYSFLQDLFTILEKKKKAISIKNKDFAERLHSDLQSKGVRSWFASYDLRTGDKILDRTDKTFRLYNKLLLILSKDALSSWWVEAEVNVAFDKERMSRQQGQPGTVLFPLRLDDAIFSANTPWARQICERHIADFTRWKQHDNYQQILERLLRDLSS